jgi:hypothetical protein
VNGEGDIGGEVGKGENNLLAVIARAMPEAIRLFLVVIPAKAGIQVGWDEIIVR